MSMSWKTVDSDARAVRRTVTLLAATWLLICASGCLIPPIVFPKTKVHGIVVDQDGCPLPHAEIITRQNPPRFIIWATPTIRERIRADANGRWRYSARKVGRLIIEAIPPQEYEEYWLPGDQRVRSIIGPFYDGDCPTNCFVLQLRKIPDASGGKR